MVSVFFAHGEGLCGVPHGVVVPACHCWVGLQPGHSSSSSLWCYLNSVLQPGAGCVFCCWEWMPASLCKFSPSSQLEAWRLWETSLQSSPVSSVPALPGSILLPLYFMALLLSPWPALLASCTKGQLYIDCLSCLLSCIRSNPFNKMPSYFIFWSSPDCYNDAFLHPAWQHWKKDYGIILS